jgi:hypothetical protein
MLDIPKASPITRAAAKHPLTRARSHETPPSAATRCSGPGRHWPTAGEQDAWASRPVGVKLLCPFLGNDRLWD